MAQVQMKKVWLVKHPLHQYEEDVKDLARKANIKIIDAKFTSLIGEQHRASDTPALTVKKRPAKRGRPPAAPTA